MENLITLNNGLSAYKSSETFPFSNKYLMIEK